MATKQNQFGSYYLPSHYYDTCMTHFNLLKNYTEVPLYPYRNERNILTQQRISGFWMAGISYKKTDASVRGLFTITNEQRVRLLALAQAGGIHK